jgi:hypothetical protein
VKGYFGEEGVRKRQANAGVAAPEKKPVASGQMEMPTPPPPSVISTAVKGEVAEPPVSIGSYTFKARIAPEPPMVLRGESTMRARCELDAGTNSWVWFCTPHQAEQILALAKAFDVRQHEMDLEFCLVLLNQDKIRSMGLSVLFDSSASWLSALSLEGDSGSLRLSLDRFAIDVDVQHTDAVASVVSVPVIRAFEAVPWEYNIDNEIPLPRSDVIHNGVVRNSVEYRKVGFGLSGKVTMAGDDVLLSVKQRNGSVSQRPSSVGQYPEFGTQDLSTTVRLAWWEWSVLGGIQVEKSSIIKGRFWSDKVQQSSDYLVIFVRPRLALSAPPKAVPVGSSRKPAETDRKEHPLLPLKGGDFPDGKPTLGLPLPEK